MDSTFSVNEYDPRLVLAALLITWLGIVTIALWQVVGVWRSANMRVTEQRRAGKRAPWATLAKLAVIIGVLRLASLMMSAGIPQITEASRILFLDDPNIPRFALRIMRSGTELEVAGGFKFGLNDDVVRVLRAAPLVHVIHLNSLGGRIGEAEKLYKTIRDRGMVTYVATECASACAIAFAGGKERWIKWTAKLGFHAPSFPGMRASDLSASVQAQRSIFVGAGYDAAFVTRALSTPNDRIWTPSTDELRRAHVITKVSDGGDFAASGYGIDVTKESLAADLEKAIPALSALRTVSPDSFSAMLDDFFAGYQQGRTENSLGDAIRKRLFLTMQTYIPLADDATLHDLRELLLDQYAALEAKDGALCYRYASGTGDENFSRLLPAELTRRELVLYERVLRTAAPRSDPPKQQLDALWARLGVEVTKRVGADGIGLLASADVRPTQYAQYCQTLITFYEEIGRLEPAEAAVMMRQVLAK